MRYALLIYTEEKAEASASPEDVALIYKAYGAYSEEMQKAGVMKGGDALEPTTTATTVKVKEGKTLTTDGPFAETKEQLGGYYEVECDNIDQAIEWAAKCPGAQHGSIEVRPIMEFEQS